jgi:3-phenylpropionate/trans-cinnamate dioxygenase ferredoxin subunit
MAFRRAAALRDIPARAGLCVRIDGIDVGLFRVGGEIHAMENQCPHAGDPLSEGRLEGPIIECAAHGWTFDVRTGFRPDDADGFPIPCFPVRLEGDDVFVDLDEPLNRRPMRRPRGDD